MKAILSLLILCLAMSITCENGQAKIEIHRVYGANPVNEKIEVYRGTAAYGTIIHTEVGRNSAFLENVIELCISMTEHTFVLSDTSSNGWAAGSYFYVVMDEIELLRSRLEDSSMMEVGFNPIYTITIDNAWSWSNEVQSTPDWRYSVKPTWQTYSRGYFPNVSTNTRYYALSVTVPPMLSGYPLFEFGVYSREGVIAYVNGEEVIRKNLPAGPVNYETRISSLDETSSYLRFTGSRAVYMSGASITLGVEIHRDYNQTIAYTDDFRAYLIPLMQSPNYRISDGSATCTSTSPTNENVENLFDNNKNTQWTAYIDPSIEVVYTFSNHRREWFNTYTLTSASSQPERDPLSWRLEATQDGVSWDRLDYQSNVIFPGRRKTLTFNLASNRRSYSAVRLAITAVRGTTETIAQLSELRLLATEGDVLDGNLLYPTEQFTYMVGITEDFSIKPLSSGFLAYTIAPELPVGMTINPDSGEISGTTEGTTAAMTTYTVSATASVTGIISTAQVSIFFTTCNSATHTRIDIIKYNQFGSDRESWSLSCPTLPDALQSTGLDGEEIQIFHACLPQEVCTLTLSDSLGDAWVAGAYLDITLYNGDRAHHLGKALVSDSDSTVIPVNAAFLVKEKDPNVKVYTGAEYKDNWYVDTAFTGNAGMWLPVVNNVTSTRRHWYIHSTVVTPIVRTNYQSYTVQFYCRAGVALYVNGQEKYRVNMPEGPMNANTDITGGSTNPYWHTYVGPMSELLDSNNVFAFDLTNAVTAATIPVDFDMLVYLDSSSGEMSLTMESIAQASSASGSHPVSRILDGNWASYTLLPRSTSTDSKWVGVKFQQESRRTINRYCVTCNPDFSRYDPTHWMLVAANDETLDIDAWTVVDVRENVRFSKREQRLCFSTNSTAAYNMYRMVMTANRNQFPTNAFAVAELELFALNGLPVQPFAYQMQTITGYLNQRFPTLTTSAEIGMVTVSPALPTGLTLDAYTGRVSGTPTVAMGMQTYTFTNTRPNATPETTTVSIAVNSCLAPQYMYFLHMPTTGAMGPKLAFNVTDQTGAMLLQVNSMPLQEEMFYPMCSDPKRINLGLSGTGITSWGQFYLEVLAEDQVVVGKAVYGSESNTFYPFYHVHPTDQWKYFVGTPAPTNWTQPFFDDNAWQVQTPGSFPALNEVTQYYRRSFTMPAVNDTTTVLFHVRVSAGTILYLNGREIYRVNMPTGTPTAETLAASEFLTTQTISGTVVLSADSLIAGTNVFAVENHRLSATRTQNDFKATLFIADYTTYAMLEGEGSTDIESTGAHGYLKAFDFLEETSYQSGPRCEGAYLQWMYPMGSRYTVNEYYFSATYGECVSNFPTAWVVEGSNNGADWSMVDYASDIMSPTGSNKVTRNFLPLTSYHTYRLRVTACKNVDTSSQCEEGLTVGEFAMFNTKIDYTQVCEGDLSFPSALVGGYSFGACPSGYTGYRRRLCQPDLTFGSVENLCTPEAPSYLNYAETSYELTTGMEITTPIQPTYVCIACTFTSSPVLPNALQLNPANGAITGIGHNATQAFFYTITGRNTAGSVSTVLRLSIVDSGANCPGDFSNGWSATPAGTNATRSCPDEVNYIGSVTRLCQNTVPPSWAEPISSCILQAPNITYPSSNVTLEKNVEIEAITPTVFAAEHTISIAPQLPAGMYFNTQNGVITGAPSIKDVVGTVYTITVLNAAGNYTTTLQISIIALTCAADGTWPETDAGDRAYVNCGQNMEGEHYRECQPTSPPQWAAAVNTCVYSAPIVTYPSPAMTLYKGVPMTTVTPAVLNLVTSWSINPQLPAGLQFNTNNGALSGTPTAVAAQASYTVTASNQHNSATVVLTITIDVLKCPADGVWLETEHSQTATAACADPANMEGTRTRMCTLSGSTAVWAAEMNSCTYRAPIISYNSAIMGYKGEMINGVEPTRQYRITQYTITPTLPAGLTLDPQSGLISGTPMEGRNSAVYTVTASNENKSGTATITIEILVPTCPANGDWAMLERGLVAYLPCSGTTGVRTRTCGESKTDRNPSWKQEDVSMCIANPEKTKPSEGKAFIRVKLQYGGVDASKLGPQEQEQLRVVLAEGLHSKGVSTNQVVTQSFAGGALTLLANGVIAHYRLEVDIDSVDTVKQALEQYVNSGEYAKAINKLGNYKLATVQIKVDTDSYSVKKYSAMNGVVVALLVVFIIFLVLFGGVMFIYLKVRSKPKQTGGLQRGGGLHRNQDFKPAGNVEDDYSSRVDVSDESDYSSRRSSRKMRFEEDDDEEEYSSRRSSRKMRKNFRDDDDDEEEEERKPRRSKKGRV